MKRLLVVGLGVVLALALSACSSASPGQGVDVPHSYTLHGTLTAPECGGGYDLDNATVMVRNQDDTLIGSSSTSAHMDSTGNCNASFTVVGLPKANFYQVKIGTHDGPAFSFAELQATKWHMDLSLS